MKTLEQVRRQNVRRYYAFIIGRALWRILFYTGALILCSCFWALLFYTLFTHSS